MNIKKLTIGILAHVDAGKTTLSEALLYKTGEIRKRGRVDHGDTFLDDNIIERNRGITIFSRQARFRIPLYERDCDARHSACEGGGCDAPHSAHAGGCDAPHSFAEVTLIDTPGHVDFSAEMERSLSVLDYALLVVSGSEGVQAHTKTLYRMLRERGIPVFVFVNKMDIAVRTRSEILEELSSELAAGMVDFSGAGDRTDEFIDAVTLYSPELAEAVLEAEESSREAVPDSSNASDCSTASGRSNASGSGEPSGCSDPSDGGSCADLQYGGISDRQIAAAAACGETVPCVFGSALREEGIELLLEVLARYTAEPERKKEFGARIYKTAVSEDGERLCFIRITGGSLKVKDKVVLRTAEGETREEKVNQIRLYSGSRYTAAEAADAGTVCAVTGLGRAIPGDSLGSEKPAGDPSIRPFMVYSLIIPDGMDSHDVMKDMQILTDEDPMLSASWSSDGSIQLRLMGQVQLEVLSAIIRERFGYEVSFGAGSVLYLETVTGIYEGAGHFEPLRHYAEVHLIIEPGERGSGIVISSDVPEDELALNWQRLIMTHLEEKEHRGVLTGAPLTDVKISLAAGRAHDKHTSGGDFREATYRAVRQGLMQARAAGDVLLLEPWCEYDIELPARCVGRAMTDIKQMGGSQDHLEQDGDTARLKGRVPAAEIAGYQQTLTGYTSGEGRLSCTPRGYDACHDADRITEESRYDPERDTDNPAGSVFVNHGGSDIVSWDEAMQHMHIGSVLSQRHSREDGSFSEQREESKRRITAEKELRRIFERTYGPAKQKRFKDARETDFKARPKLTEEEASRNAERNREIRARHGHRTAPPEEKPVMILIDGYNFIYSDQYLKELSAIDMGSARDQMLDRISNYAGYTGCEVAVVFDAYNVPGGTGHEEDRNGVRVIYTAADEPADIRMGIMTDTIRDRQIYVVSSDSLVQQDALGHGALRIPSRDFSEMLTRTEEEIRRVIGDGSR